MYIACAVLVMYVVKIIFDNNEVLSVNFIYHYLSQIVEWFVPFMLLVLIRFDRKLGVGLKGIQLLIYLYVVSICADTVLHQSLNGILAFDIFVFNIISNNCIKKKVDESTRYFVVILILAELFSLLLCSGFMTEKGIITTHLKSFVVELLFVILFVVRKLYDNNKYIFLSIIFALQVGSIVVLGVGLFNSVFGSNTSMQKINYNANFYILSSADKSMALTEIDGKITFEKFVSGANQRFFTTKNVSLEENASFGIVNKLSGKFCDVSGARFEEFTPVVGWQENSLEQQVWHLYKRSDNKWIITAYDEDYLLSYNPWFPEESAIIATPNELFGQEFYLVNTYEKNILSGFVSDGNGARTIIIYLFFVIVLLGYQTAVLINNASNTKGK